MELQIYQTPPPSLVQRWSVSSPIQHSDESWAYELFIAHQSARWGSDQELEACCKWLVQNCGQLSWWEIPVSLRAARRPKPPTLKEQALDELGDAYDKSKIDDTTYDTIRKALETIND
jgi:hypothetical protein